MIKQASNVRKHLRRFLTADPGRFAGGSAVSDPLGLLAVEQERLAALRPRQRNGSPQPAATANQSTQPGPSEDATGPTERDPDSGINLQIGAGDARRARSRPGGRTMTITGDRQPRSLGRAATAIKNLSPGYFAFVMATSIISTGTFLLGPSWLSRALLVIASAGLVVLGVALVIRLVLFRPGVAAEFRDPGRVFGFFAIAAGIDVLGIRLAAAGHPLTTAILAGVAAAVWLALTYGVPASLLLARSRDSVLGGVNGTWLLWVVATQSLSLDSSTLVRVWPSQSMLLAPVAVGLWSIGLMLYLLLVSLILLRWLTVPMTPQTLGPSYWILMGATAIIVLAGARILGLPAPLPAVKAAAGFVEGSSFALWAFGTWWIPLLVVLGFWRYVRHHWPLTYEAALWSVVFPLGMYSVATLTFGKAAHLAFMEPLSRFMLWAAVAAWVAVAAALLHGSPASQDGPERRRQRLRLLRLPPRHDRAEHASWATVSTPGRHGLHAARRGAVWLPAWLGR